MTGKPRGSTARDSRARLNVAVVRHVPFEDLGTLAAALDRADAGYSYVDLYRDPEAPVSLSNAGLILMGGPMSANDDADYIRRELRLISEFVEAGKPVLGICLGSQLIAKAAGARVYRNAVKEIGWAHLHWTEAGRRDPLFTGLHQPENVFHWHGETFDLPAGADWLAYSDSCRHQAFRLGNVYGLQFHLEVTPAMIKDWLGQEVNRPDVSDLAAPVDPDLDALRLCEIAETVFGRWTKLLESASRSGTPAA